MFYGRPETNLDKLKTLNCDIIGFFGNKDQSPSPAAVTEFENNMRNVNKKLETYKYEAGHGFANPSNPSFNAEAAADVSARCSNGRTSLDENFRVEPRIPSRGW